jgi:hypothetical protein
VSAVRMTELDKLLDITSQVFKLGPRELRSPTRNKGHCRARHVMSYVARTVLCEKFEAIGAAFGRHHTSIQHSVRVVRDSPAAFEPELSAVTRALADIDPIVTPAQELDFLRRRVLELERENASLRNAPPRDLYRLHWAFPESKDDMIAFLRHKHQAKPEASS